MTTTATTASTATPVAAAPASPMAQRCWPANLAALRRCAPPLAAALDNLPFAALPPTEPTRDGRFTVRLPADDGGAIYAHSRNQPAEEARRFVAGHPRAQNATFVMAGIGLGFHVEELERQYEQPVIIVVEDDLALLKAALCVCDFSQLLAERRLYFLTAADKRLVHETLHQINANLMLGFAVLQPPHAARYHVEFQTRMRSLILDFASYCQLQILTLLKNARITCKNIAYNLPAYMLDGGIETLHNRAAGWPAIVVAAGPSLARQLDLLAELRDKAVIIAVQTVFKLLLARGIRPHFVTSLDYHEVSAQFFHGVVDVGDCTLVAEPKATWHVFDVYPGRRRVLHAPFVDDLLRDAAPQRGRLPAGSTVAHLAFYLAQYLGCDPIIFVGQDLCYSEGLYYPPGMPIEAIWRPELGRFQTAEMKQWERIARSRPILRTVKDVHGRDAYTDGQLFTYAEQFQADFAAAPQRIIHAGPAGMRLEGTQVMSLHDAAAEFCTRPLPAALLADACDSHISHAQARPVPTADAPLVSRAAAALAERVAEIGRMREIADETDRLLAQLAALADQPARFNRLLVRVEKLHAEMQLFDRTYKLVTDVSQLAELRRFSADRRLAGARQETAETARQRLTRDREFVQSFRDGCDYLLELLPQARRRLLERAP